MSDPTVNSYFTPDFAPADKLSAREYAAIHLKVPNSGADWLDEMIETSLRNDLAAKAMQSYIADSDWRSKTMQAQTARVAYMVADAMRKAAKP
jgi:metal-responsive CopG/Arc/MetJ family transcriptional regulator